MLVNILRKNLLHLAWRRRNEVEVDDGMGYLKRKDSVGDVFY